MLLKLLIVFMMGLMMGSSVQAADDASVVSPKSRSPEEQKKLDEMRKRIREKETEMNGSKWEVVLGSLDPKIKGQKDTLLFQNRQMISVDMSKRGFGPTNYTVSVPPEEDSEGGIWETMKTGKDGVIFIRGEWEKDNMHGFVTEQLEEGKKINEYIFTTSSRVAVSPTSSEDPSDLTSLNKTSNDDSGPKVLVSKETPLATVSSFTPGTTDEVSKPAKKRGY